MILLLVFRQKDGRNVLMVACYGGHLKVAEYLVAQSLDVNAMNYVSSHINDE